MTRLSLAVIVAAPIAVDAFLVVWPSEQAVAFRAESSLHLPQTSHQRHGSPLRATVFNVPGRETPSWMDDDGEGGFKSTHFSSSFTPGFCMNEDVFEILNQRKQKLARLAVAFSPSEIELHQITDIHVLSFDSSRLSIEAIVCEDDDEGCVSFGIPLDLPMICRDQSIDCILHNIDLLDRQASVILQKKAEKQRVQAEFEWELETMHRDLQIANMVYPSWWIKPTGRAMQNECKRLQSLLNSCDLKYEVNMLARYALSRSGMPNYVVNTAMVTAIGNAGILFSIRAHEKISVTSPSVASMKASMKKKSGPLISVSLSFEKSADTATDLRQTVLKIIDRASEFAQKLTP